MNSKELEFSLRSLEADAAIEAMERRERGLPPHPETPLADSEVAELTALGGELGEEFLQGKTDELLRAIQHGASPPEQAAPEPGPVRVAPARLERPEPPAGEPAGAQVVAIGAARRTQTTRWGRLRYASYAAAPLAAAAAVLLWLFPFAPLSTPIESAQLAASSSRGAVPPGGVGADAAPLRISRDDCYNLKVALQKSARSLPEDVETQVYLVSQGRPLRWELSLQPGTGGAVSTTASCQPLPRQVAEGPAELVVLIGSPGRLLWHGAEAVRQSTGAQGEYRGIQYVRRSLLLGPDPSGSGK